MKNNRTRRSTSPSFSSPCRYSARPRIRRFMQQVRKAVRAMWATESSKPRPVRISVIFNASSTCHENRPMAFRIAKSGSSINTKSYQFIVSIIGLSTLLAQILVTINPKRGTSSTARLWSLTRRRTGFEHPEYSPPAWPTDCRPGQPHPWSARFHDGCLYRRFFHSPSPVCPVRQRGEIHYRCVHVVFGTSTVTPTI